MSGRSPPTPPGLYAAGVEKRRIFALFSRARERPRRGPGATGGSCSGGPQRPRNGAPLDPRKGYPARPGGGSPYDHLPGLDLAAAHWALRRRRGGGPAGRGRDNNPPSDGRRSRRDGRVKRPGPRELASKARGTIEPKVRYRHVAMRDERVSRRALAITGLHWHPCIADRSRCRHGTQRSW